MKTFDAEYLLDSTISTASNTGLNHEVLRDLPCAYCSLQQESMG